MSEPRATPGPSLFALGEAKARGGVLVVGSGVMAFTLGGRLVALLTDWIGPILSPTLAFVVGWGLDRLWLWLVLPLLGWVVGRLLHMAPGRFALGAGLTGELFSILVQSAGSGLGMVFLDGLDVVARVVTLALGLWVTAMAGAIGRRAAQAAQGRAEALAARQAAEYAEVMARAGGAPSEPPVPPRPPVL